ncbi:E3 ubiquitin-protein ligase rnf8-B-like isoform X2 [Periplaneta americana]|uniref:E3 ubiquitin-protein ligase rnf8-B-like isoform X2 n=1 Tax=Periplaneta americana TaxID=6978 RepID=UPI0037E8E29F
MGFHILHLKLSKMTEMNEATSHASTAKIAQTQLRRTLVTPEDREFSLGRAKHVSYNIPDVAVSKTQCIFQKTDEAWTLCDKSTFGTFLNKRKLEKDKPTTLKDGDQIEFSTYNFTFCTKDTYSPCNKKMRLDIKVDTDTNRNKGQKTAQKIDLEEDRLQDSGSTTVQKAEERRMSQNTLLKEKQVLEEKLKEMQNLLEEKDKAQEMLNKKLQQKEEERLRDLKELQEQKDRQAEAMREALEKEVREKEEILRIQLAREIQSLQEEKLKIENNIRDEHSKIKGESAENLKRLKEELQKVKNDLSNVEGKKQYLEKELEETTKAKEEASESCLRAKQEILENFGELMETELQCGICNELFVTATTLNCTHTFCRSCILEWKKKKKECPICRARISSENRSLVVDNFIDRMVQNLSAEMQNRRQELVESRQIQELLGPKEKPEPSRGPQRLRRRRGRHDLSQSSSEDASANSIIVISSESSSESDYTERSRDSDSEYLSDESVPGDPDVYYGGYGHCYNCGRRGHWANGCPNL